MRSCSSPLRGLVLFVLAWKLGIELLRPLVDQPNYQFVERAKDYALPLCMFWLVGSVWQADNGPVYSGSTAAS